MTDEVKLKRYKETAIMGFIFMVVPIYPLNAIGALICFIGVLMWIITAVTT
jgi:nitrate reductase NapE component